MTKQILVSGAGGFIGSHLTEKLVRQGNKVKALVRYNSKNSWGWLDHSEAVNDIEVVTGDVREFDSVKKAMAGCDEVFHLAALIGIPYSYESPWLISEPTSRGPIIFCRRQGNWVYPILS